VLAASFIRAMRQMMEVASTSETLANFYQTKRRNNPEDSHLHTSRRENLKYHRCLMFIYYKQKWRPNIVHLNKPSKAYYNPNVTAM
jgi:hypothetical protein